MGGGIFQLIAYGSQDVYLTGNPQITFFKAIYSRHSNFAIESIEQVFKGAPKFNTKISVNLGRNGDLLHKMILEAEISSESSKAILVNRPGHALIKFVEIEIGGQIMDKQYGEWMDLWCQISHSRENFQKLDNMISGRIKNSVGNNHKLYIPLQFWFNRNIGLALPLIALQYHEVKLNVFLNKEANIRKNHINIESGDKYKIKSLRLFCDYIFLDTDERRRFAQVSHEYLIDQVQFNSKSIVKNKYKEHVVKLNLNHPCKELFWIVQSNLMIGKDMDGVGIYNFPFDYSRPNSADNSTMDLEKWEFNSIEYWVNRDSKIIFDNENNRIGKWGEDNTLFENAGGTEPFPGDVNTIKKTVKIYQDNLGDSIKGAVLELNGADRFSKRSGTYFRIVQPYQHHKGGYDQQRGLWYSDEFDNDPLIGPFSKEKGYIYNYSFAINPDEHQPSGTCNFSRIDNAVLRLEMNNVNREVQSILDLMKEAISPNTSDIQLYKELEKKIPNTPINTIRVYATNYNVLRITSGMGGLAYSN